MQSVPRDAHAGPRHLFSSGRDHSIAVAHGSAELSYSELDHRADYLCAYLADLGILPGDTVAICMERSIDWIVAALAIMRSGAAYVPFDLIWPESRLRFAIRDSGARALVARATLLDHLQLDMYGIDPARDRAAIAAAPGFAPPFVDPESLAYIIYTSGSSGSPKGVEITHANLAHLIDWHLDAFNVTQDDRAGHLAGLGFDAAVWEIWPHLAAGATLCLADDDVRASPERIHDWIIEQGITIAFVPTVHAAPLMAMAWPADLPLRYLLTGGDVLQVAPPANLPFTVVNNYGPTECTVVATSTMLEPGSQQPPSIGRPIAGTSVYLLNDHRQPVGDGIPGELYIGGAGVGRGYRNLPESTRLAFLPDPFSNIPGARMYRTGDRGLLLPDGTIAFRGRLDRQAKIRGQRIELDEISSTLAHHPAVEFATAVVTSNPAGENQLVAYVLPRVASPIPTRGFLQEHLLQALPEYMVPAVFVQLQKLPLSPNGKIDFSALPAPDHANTLPGDESQPAESAVEEEVLAIIRDLLENQQVAPSDNFFLAGGHSLLGMQLVMRLAAAFGIDLSLRQLFDAPTPARLASVVSSILDEKRLIAIWSELLDRSPANPISLDDSFLELSGDDSFLTRLQQRILEDFDRHLTLDQLNQAPTIRRQLDLLRATVESQPSLPPGVVVLQPHGTRNSIFWIHYLSVSLARVVGTDQPFLSVMLSLGDFPALGEAPTLEDIASCIVHKIQTTQPLGALTLGGLCLGGILAYEVAQQLQAAGREVSLLVLLDTPNPSFLDSPYPLSPRLNDPGYLLKRASRLGIRKSLAKVRGRLPLVDKRKPKTELSIAQEMIESAAADYTPQTYHGKVLLLLATERPSHVDFYPGWQAVIPASLHTQYLEGDHDHLTQALNVQHVADAIAAHVKLSTDISHSR